MQNQPTGDDPIEGDQRIQRMILTLVVSEQQRPWSIEEIARTYERRCSKSGIEDAIDELRSVGLINQADQLVFASQAAIHIERLGMLGV